MQQICQDLWKGAIKNDEHMAEYFSIMAPIYSWKIRNNLPVSRPAATHRFSLESVNEGFGKLLNKFSYTKFLKNILCPTLILVGEDDWVTAPKYSIKMAKKISNSELHIFKNADHSLESDVPDQFFDVIKKFI